MLVMEGLVASVMDMESLRVETGQWIAAGLCPSR